MGGGGWGRVGGDEERSGEAALQEGNKHIDTAIKIFKEVWVFLFFFWEGVGSKGYGAVRKGIIKIFKG